MATVVEDELEQVDAKPKKNFVAPKRQQRTDGDLLQGFNDPRTQEYRPLVNPPSDETRAETSAEDAPEFQDALARDSAGGADGSDANYGQQLRSEKIAKQRQDQAASDARVRQWKDIQQGKKAGEIDVFAQTSRQLAIEVRRRSWQVAQEGAEDTALTFADFFLVSGPVAVGVYLIRWVAGNMMGGLITQEQTVPGTGEKVDIPLVPGYSLMDPLDMVRHMKFLMVGSMTFLVWGFIIMVLYYVTNWDKLVDLTMQIGWETIYNLFKQ